MAKSVVLKVAQIDGPAFDLRTEENAEFIRALADSIAAVGLLQPLGVVQEGARYRLLYGNQRYKALRWMGRETAECKVLGAEEAATIGAAAAENMVRAAMTPVEEARSLRYMIDTQGMTVDAVAKAVGHTSSWVRARLEILVWPEDIVLLVGKAELPVAVARELVQIDAQEVRSHLLTVAIQSGCTAAQMRQWRHDWEVQRAANPDAPWGDVVGSAPPEVPLPQAACAWCAELHPSPQLVFLRLCSPCQTTLYEVRRQVMSQDG